MIALKRSSKGFTLIEVLIVVVIIAILASLILPRMTAQTQRARVAEGLQMVGAIKRAAERGGSVSGAYPAPNGGYIYSSPSSWGGDTSEGWDGLGLQAPKSSHWSYEYWGWDSGFQIYAQDDDPVYCNWLFYFVDGDSMQWSCDGPNVTGTDDVNPCKIK
ncbi:MAG TPA: prepilin-type N-terminal cleavage/methylation domain-containing protein [Candidatus Omnitrophota bacterium]|nr:prepilin-type N-terminal cleavage/methylation domain-containing protein [Candidatus Omnitrophota bacterium]HPS36387.1 prepilin-type N-terminal cleavage/methylation domain-containing protein [Candidatus Omnitrophota bacterium]